jgi:hypothetical protein
MKDAAIGEVTHVDADDRDLCSFKVKCGNKWTAMRAIAAKVGEFQD